LNALTEKSRTSARGNKLGRLVDWAVYACIAGLLLLLVWRGAHGPKEGTPAQAFSLQLVDGDGHFRLAEQRGKPVLMEVFASWCGACERAAPMLQDVYREATQQGVVVVGVSIDDDARAAQQVARSWPIPYPVALDDGSVKRGYGVSLVPTFVLIDRDGTIKNVASGVPSRRTLSRWLTEL
jgi:cytochrome c biogenesis protein CcmG, thiol:disulfide interchange protein DsbE